MTDQNEYIAICTVYGRTHHSIPTESQKIIHFQSSQDNLESKLEEKINSFIFTNPESRITEINVNGVYKIEEEIIPAKTTYETSLKKVYGNDE